MQSREGGQLRGGGAGGGRSPRDGSCARSIPKRPCPRAKPCGHLRPWGRKGPRRGRLLGTVAGKVCERERGTRGRPAARCGVRTLLDRFPLRPGLKLYGANPRAGRRCPWKRPRELQKCGVALSRRSARPGRRSCGARRRHLLPFDCRGTG